MTRVSDATSRLTSGRLLARNAIWNLAGQILPVAAGVVAVPPLVKVMGTPRFGLLSLAWIIVGYFSLFDFGIGRALTKLVADKIGEHNEVSIPPLAWTSLLLMSLLGATGGMVMLAVSSWLVHQLLKIPQDLQTEALRSFFVLAVAIPIITTTSGLRGILEAQQQFRILNLIRIPMGVFSFVGPLFVLPFSHKLVPAVSILVAGRFVGFLAHLLACLYTMPSLRANFGLNGSLVGPVLKFGGWMTISNLVSPIMVYLDRFFISALLSLGAVAYYTAPFDIVTRLTMIPSALVGVLFPALALSQAADPGRADLLMRRGVKYVFFAIFPLAVLIAATAPELLQLWVGKAFAENSTSVLRWLAAGVLINCLSYVPFALIQSAGRPDVTAKFHMVELPLYLVLLFLLVKTNGIVGASIAWTSRVTLDAMLLFWFARRLLPQSFRYLAKQVSTVAVVMGALYLTTIPQTLAVRATLLASTLLLFGLGIWSWGLDPVERRSLFSLKRETSNVKLAEEIRG